MSRVAQLVVGLMLISMAIGCGGGGGDGGGDVSSLPPTVDVTGTWVGSYNSTVFGFQVATFSAQQIGASVTGTFSSSSGALGSVSGSVSDDTVSFTITVTTPGCSGSFHGTGIVDVPAVGNPTMSFSYSGSSNASCGGPESGTGNLTLQ